MRNFFTNVDLSVSLARLSEDKIELVIESDFVGSQRKSQLYVNSKKLGEEVERFWKSIKTKKLLSLRLCFDEIDYYDDEVDVYETPRIAIERGLRRAVISSQRHGSVPKDWSGRLTFIFADTTTKTPIIEVIENALGDLFTSKDEKIFSKELKPFLQKKAKHVNYSTEEEED